MPVGYFVHTNGTPYQITGGGVTAAEQGSAATQTADGTIGTHSLAMGNDVTSWDRAVSPGWLSPYALLKRTLPGQVVYVNSSNGAYGGVDEEKLPSDNRPSFATIAAAYNYVLNHCYPAENDVTFILRPGIHNLTETLVLDGYPRGKGIIRFEGVHGSTIITKPASTSMGEATILVTNGHYSFEQMTIENSNAYGGALRLDGTAYVTTKYVDFTAASTCSWSRGLLSVGGSSSITLNYVDFSANTAISLLHVRDNGSCVFDRGGTFNCGDSTYNVLVEGNGSIRSIWTHNPVFSGTVTGAYRYHVAHSGSIISNGSGANLFPGDKDGTTANSGVYV